MMWKLVRKTKSGFMYERHNDEFNYTHNLDVWHKNTYTGYRGIEIYSYQKDVNKDGFNNAVGLRRNDLLRLPFMILHFKMYRLFGKERMNEHI
jgi:hypothetical protein